MASHFSFPFAFFNGTVTPTPPVSENTIFNGPVYKVLSSGTDLFVGGAFTGIRPSVAQKAKILNQSTAAPVTSYWDDKFPGGSGGAVLDSIEDATHLYIVGAFQTYGGVTARSIAKIDKVTGILDPTFAANFHFNGAATHIVFGPGNTLFVAGSFTQHNGNARRGIVKIDKVTGDTVLAFNQTLVNLVQCGVLEFETGTNSIYVSCQQTAFNGLRKLDGTTGAEDVSFVWKSAGSSNYGSFVCIDFQINVTEIVAVGTFLTYDGAPAQGIIKISKFNGNIVQLPPEGGFRNLGGSFFAVTTLFINGAEVIVGGRFDSTVSGVTYGCLARLNLITMAVDLAFSNMYINPNFSSSTDNFVVNKVDVVGNDIYVGGNFRYCLGDYTGSIVKISKVFGNRDVTFNPGPGFAVFGNTGVVNNFYFNSLGQLVVFGGFNLYGGTLRVGLAKFNGATLIVDPTFDTSVGISNVLPTSINFDRPEVRDMILVNGGTNLIIVGNFKFYKNTVRNGTAKLSATTGAIDVASFNSLNADRPVNCIAQAIDTTLYIGGEFFTFNGLGRRKMAKLNADGTTNGTWANTYGSNTATDYVNTIALFETNSMVIFGGVIDSYVSPFGAGQAPVGNMIALITANGELSGSLPGITPGNGANGEVFSIIVNGTTMYIGGAFTVIGGLARERLCTVNMNIGQINPESITINNSIRSILVDGSDLYVGGDFGLINGVTQRTRVAKFDRATLAFISTFDTSNGFNDSVRTLGVSFGNIVVGGDFQTYKGLTCLALNVVNPLNASNVL